MNSKYHLVRSGFAIPILPRKIHLLVIVSKDADERGRHLLKNELIFSNQNSHLSTSVQNATRSKTLAGAKKAMIAFNSKLKDVNLGVFVRVPQTTYAELGHYTLFYLRTQILFQIGELVTCRWSKLTNSLAEQQLELSTHTRSSHALETAANLCASRRQGNDFSVFFFFFFPFLS